MNSDPPHHPDGWTAPRVGARRSALILASGSAGNFVLQFGRSMLLGRLLTVADFGIAGTFMAALNLLQMTSNFSFHLMLVQDRRGGDPDFAAAIKGLGVARGLFLAVLIVVLSGPLARLMGQPDLGWAYACMAIVPLMQAFNHNDRVRMKRQMRFGPHITVGIGANLITLLMVWPLVAVLGDWRVALALYAIQSIMQTILTHAVAEHPYRIGWDWQVARKGVAFGWPLMLAGIMLFGVMQGDRIIVANFYGNHELGLISAVLVMVMAPVQFAGELVRSYFLPLMSRYQDDPPAFDARAAFTLQATLCGTLLGSLLFALLGPAVLVLVFGQKYAEGGAYVALLGIAFSLQFMRSGSNTVAMARGRNTNMLIANMVRIAFLGPAVAVAMGGGDIVTVLAIGAVGQFCAIAISVALLYLRAGLGNARAMALPYLGGTVCLVCLAISIWQPEQGYAGYDTATLMAALFFAAAMATSRVMHSNLLRQLRRRG